MTSFRTIALALTTAVFATAAGAFAQSSPQTWAAITNHSSAQFTATHFGLAHVTGILPIQSATISGPKAPALPASIVATLDPNGVDTRDSDRDSDLRSPHFFDAAKYPTVTFTSTSIVPVDAKTFDATGNLTLHGVTKPVTLHTTFLGQITDPRGHLHAAYEATTTIKRSDFGITYGPVIVGDDVAIQIDIEATPKQ